MQQVSLAAASCFQSLVHLPSPCWAVENLVFDAMDTQSFRGPVEVSGGSGACGTVGTKEQRIAD